MEVEILKWLPEGGSVVAFIVLVIIFLKQQKVTSDAFQGALDRQEKAQSDRIKLLCEAHKDSLQRLATAQKESMAILVARLDRIEDRIVERVRADPPRSN